MAKGDNLGIPSLYKHACASFPCMFFKSFVLLVNILLGNGNKKNKSDKKNTVKLFKPFCKKSLRFY